MLLRRSWMKAGVSVLALIVALLACQAIMILPEASGDSGNVPTEPTNLRAVPGPYDVTLTWDAPTSDGGLPILSYWVFLVQNTNWVGPYPDDDEPIAKLGSDARSYLHSGLHPGTNYIYYVKANNANGLSPYSMWAWAVPGWTVPGKPQLYAWAGDERMELRWVTFGSGGTAVTNYNVYRGLDASSMTLIASTSAWASFDGVAYGDTYYTDTGVTNWVNYSFCVTAVNPMGESERSNVLTKRPLEAPRDLKATPSNVDHCGDAKIELNWTFPDAQMPHVVGFKTYWYEHSSPVWQDKQNRSCTFHVSGGWGYSFRVSAVYDTGEESFSDITYVGAPMCEGSMGGDWMFLVFFFAIAVVIAGVVALLIARGRRPGSD